MWTDWERPVVSQLPVEEKDIYEGLKAAVGYLHGEYGMGVLKFNLAVKFFNPYTRVFVLRSRRGAHAFTLSALPFVRKIKEDAATLRVLKIAGTIRSCLKFLRNYDCKVMLSVLRRCDEEEKIEAKEAVARVYAMFEETTIADIADTT